MGGVRGVWGGGFALPRPFLKFERSYIYCFLCLCLSFFLHPSSACQHTALQIFSEQLQLGDMLAIFTSCVFGMLAFSAMLASVSALDVMKIDNSTKLTWCQNQVGFCTNVCQELTNGAETHSNQCDIQTLDFICECSDGAAPNITEYTYTIPYFLCTAENQECIQNCKLSDNNCYTGCTQKRNCTAEFPKNYNQSIPTSLPQPTAPAGTQATGIPPGIFDNAANSVHSWTSVGGSSLLGLVVFLTVGVLFGDQRMD
ncbi:unnamed protein product [Mortierella alpina]